MQQNDDLFELLARYFLLNNHAPQIKQKLGFIHQPTLFDLGVFELLFGAFHRLEDQQDARGLEDGDAGLNIDEFLIREGI